MPTVTGGPVANVQGMFSSFVSGNRLVDGGDLSQMASLIFGYSPTVQSCGTAATSTAAIALGTVLGYGMNLVSVSTTGGAITLPPAIPGAQVMVQNQGASTASLWAAFANPNNGGSADSVVIAAASVATAASAAVSTGRVSIFMCFATGTWKQVYLGAS